jgi:hypothetical protein
VHGCGLANGGLEPALAVSDQPVDEVAHRDEAVHLRPVDHEHVAMVLNVHEAQRRLHGGSRRHELDIAGHDEGDRRRLRIASRRHDAHEQIALREDAADQAVLRHDEDRPDLALAHERHRIGHRRRRGDGDQLLARLVPHHGFDQFLHELVLYGSTPAAVISRNRPA